MSLGLWGTFIAYPVAKHNDFENTQFRPLHKTDRFDSWNYCNRHVCES